MIMFYSPFFVILSFDIFIKCFYVNSHSNFNLNKIMVKLDRRWRKQSFPHDNEQLCSLRTKQRRQFFDDLTKYFPKHICKCEMVTLKAWHVCFHFLKESFPQQERWYLSFDDTAGLEMDRVVQVVIQWCIQGPLGSTCVGGYLGITSKSTRCGTMGGLLT